MPFGKKKITVKQKKFSKAYVENGGNASKAAKDIYSYKNPRNAKVMGYQNLQKTVVQEEIKTLLDRAGLDLETLNAKSVEIINDGINHGKSTKASAVSMLQFMYKLHNAIPATKSLKASLILPSQSLDTMSYDEIKQSLELSAKTTHLLLESLKK